MLKRKEILFFSLLLAGALIAWFFLRHPADSSRSGMIRITVDGTVLGEFPLDQDQVIQIADTNTCEIRDGKARMIEASCPDHICMEDFSPIDEHGGMIVCLPNRVIIEGISPSGSGGISSAGQVDAVS